MFWSSFFHIHMSQGLVRGFHLACAVAGKQSTNYRELKTRQAFRKFLPLFDQVTVERSTDKTVTKGGIILLEKSQGKVLQAIVAIATLDIAIAILDQALKEKVERFNQLLWKVGDSALLPEYRGTKVVLDTRIISYLELALLWYKMWLK